MMRFSTVLVTLFAVASLGIACSDDPAVPGGPAPDPLDQTPRNDSEAEAIALGFSGELVAPQDLYEEVHQGLARVRLWHSNAIPELEQIHYRPCWTPGELYGTLTEEATDEYQAGTFTEWNALNTELRVQQIETRTYSFDPEQIRFHLYFEGRLHPERLAEMYEALASVEEASNGVICFDGSALYPRIIDGGISYLFRRGYGDCVAGCAYSEFWYFKVFDGISVEYVGHWDPQTEPEPAWWDEARTAWCASGNGGLGCN